MANNSWQYEYNLTDHLGNVRAVFAVNPQGQAVLQQKTDYYPFGMVMNQSNPGIGPENKFLYNGIEIQDDVVAGKKLDWYDYGFRFYDPQLGRFHTLDPRAEKYFNLSPYNYVANNPIIYIDPRGDTINISEAFRNNEQAMKSYNEWATSKAGKRFIKDYGIGGKYETISVNFDLLDDNYDYGKTEVYGVNKVTGVASELTPERSIQRYKDVGYNVATFRNNLKDNEFLKFFILIPGNVLDPFVVKLGESIIHETQHLRIMHMDIITKGYLYYSGADQHYHMIDKNLGWYRERFEYWKEKVPSYSDEFIEKLIINFQIGWP